MRKEIRTKADYIDYLSGDVKAEFLEHYKVNADGAKVAIQAISEFERLTILCDDLSLDLTLDYELETDLVYIDDILFINIPYALHALIDALPSSYINTHEYLLFTDEDLYNATESWCKNA